jgi:hypothetical protein
MKFEQQLWFFIHQYFVGNVLAAVPILSLMWSSGRLFSLILMPKRQDNDAGLALKKPRRNLKWCSLLNLLLSFLFLYLLYREYEISNGITKKPDDPKIIVVIELWALLFLIAIPVVNAILTLIGDYFYKKCEEYTERR